MMRGKLDHYDVVEYINKIQLRNRELEDIQNNIDENLIDSRKFYAVKMTVKEVAKMHDVDPRTVRAYISFGYIEKHPDSTDAMIYIRMSIALKLDFTQLRKRSLYPKRKS